MFKKTQTRSKEIKTVKFRVTEKRVKVDIIC